MRGPHGECLRCYENVKGRANHRGHYGYRPRPALPILKQWEEAEMKRPKSTGPDGVAGVPARGQMLSRLDQLFSYLTEDKWEDGAQRQRASILIIADGPLFKCWLNDRATDRTAWSSGETLEAAMEQMEEFLLTDSTPWRTSEGSRKKK